MRKDETAMIGRNLSSKYANLSLRGKLIWAIGGVSFLVALLSAIGSFYVELAAFKGRLLNEYKATARMVSINLEAAVAFKDEQDSAEILSMLSSRSRIELGIVYLSDGTELARYWSSEDIRPSESLNINSTSEIKSGRILVNEAITVDDREVGRVVIQANMGEVREYLALRGLIALSLLAISLAVAIGLARRLSEAVARPVRQLAETAHRITKEQDFSTRQEKLAEDETGRLVDAFNEMMAEIEKRDGLVRSNEARFRGYFDFGIIGAGILDTELRWKELNGRMAEMLGVRPEELMDQPFLDSIEGDSSLFSIDSLRDKAAQGLTLDCWLKRSGDEDLYARVSIRVISGTSFHDEHALVLAQDITDRKLHEEELMTEKERAEALSRAKDEFLSVISHELRTPLSPIIGYVEMLQAEDKGGDSKQLELIRDSAMHLLGLINDVLDYSRIERGVFALESEWFDYRELCVSSIELFKAEADAKGVSLSYDDLVGLDGEREDMSIKSDRLRLRQVILNLVSNAIKFTSNGKVDIRSKLLGDGDGPFVFRVEVEDTGAGIDPSKRNVVFDPFVQVDASLAREHTGLGLGLAISRKIILALDGRIDCESEVNEGSRFWFEIPVEAKPSRLERSSSETELTERSIRRGRILLVEDEPVNRELAASLLQGMNQDVISASDGFQAIELAREGSFDLIIMDIMMPRMSGLEAAAAIREAESEGERTPIVAVTAHLRGSDSHAYQAAGIDERLAKPYTLSKLQNALERWMGEGD